jgi:hypothetical protein
LLSVGADDIGSDEFAAMNKEMALQGITLLKNDPVPSTAPHTDHDGDTDGDAAKRQVSSSSSSSSSSSLQLLGRKVLPLDPTKRTLMVGPMLGSSDLDGGYEYSHGVGSIGSAISKVANWTNFSAVTGCQVTCTSHGPKNNCSDTTALQAAVSQVKTLLLHRFHFNFLAFVPSLSNRYPLCGTVGAVSGRGSTAG